MNRQRRILLLLLVCVAASLGWATKHCRHYIIPKRFVIVEPGQLYRGGWQKPYPLRHILQKYQIKTLLNLACKPTEPDADGEGAIVREHGVNWHKILMPGTGLGTYTQLDEAADALADPAKRPVFFHCAGGTHRTNMALAAYRLKHCGWTLDQVVAELKRYRFTPSRRKQQFEHLKGYIEHLRNSTAASLK